MPLTVATFQPVYGQGKGPKSESHTKSTEDLQSQARPVPPAPPSTEANATNLRASDTQNDGTKNHTESYLHRLFSPENLPNIGLLIAGLIGIIVAVRTLRAIKVQADIMERQTKVGEDAAKAAKDSAESIKRSERAWIQAGLDMPKLKLENLASASPNNDLNWFFINAGRTPARVLEIAARYRLIECLNRIPKEPEWKEKLPYCEKLLLPDERILSFQPLEPSHLTPEEITAIRTGERTLFAYGFVSYLDVFGDRHETRFCYLYFVPQGDMVTIVRETWVPHIAAPAAYSKAT